MTDFAPGSNARGSIPRCIRSSVYQGRSPIRPSRSRADAASETIKNLVHADWTEVFVLGDGILTTRFRSLFEGAGLQSDAFKDETYFNHPVKKSG